MNIDSFEPDIVDRLVIVSGASRGIGKAYLNKFKECDGVFPVGINRTGSAGYKLDLMDTRATHDFVQALPLDSIEDIVFIHSVGIDKFEPDGKPEIDRDGDGVDDEVFASNYLMFKNIADPLVERVIKEDVLLTMVNIGSVSDSFNVPFWRSFTHSKNMVRQYGKSLYHGNITSLMLNISSTLDEDGNTYARKGVDTRYWLSADEFVERSFETVDSARHLQANYAEIDYFKPNPGYRPDYFTNLQALYAAWQRDLGYEGEDIPRGLRI